jgi:hypothetical protein
MLERKDLLNNVGRPAAVCNYLKDSILSGRKIYEELDSDVVVTVSTDFKGDIPMMNMLNSYKLVFIPLSVVEEKIITDNVMTSLENAEKSVITLNRLHKIQKTKDKYNEEYSKLLDKYEGYDNVMKADCCVFMYEDDAFIDVYTVHPSFIVNDILLNEPVYHCSVCGQKIKTDPHDIIEFIPDMYYYPGTLLYYCNDCFNSLNEGDKKHLLHVGE